MPEDTTDLVRRGDVADLSKEELERFYSIAKSLALSKMFPDATLADEAFTKVLMGRDLGLSPTQSMTGIHIVKGKPQIAATTLAGFVRKSDRYDYSIQEHTTEVCSLMFWYDGDEAGVSTFTMAEAGDADLVKPGSGWAKFPRNMLFARAMSNGVKWYCPDLMGGVPVYTEGDVFESTATEITAPVGSGEAQGIELGPEVEAIIDRATKMGHAGLSNRPSLEIALAQRAPEVVERWLVDARADLDRFEAESNEPSTDAPVEAEKAPDDVEPVSEEKSLQRYRLKTLRKMREEEQDPENKRQLDEEITHIEGLLS